MFPGMGGRGMNPKKLNAMMRQMGIEMEDIDDVEEVVIRTPDKEYVFSGATVSKMTAQGQITWQVMGDVKVVPRAKAGAVAAAPEGPTFTEDDVALVAEQAKVSKDEARKALAACDGQTAEAILKLMGEE